MENKIALGHPLAEMLIPYLQMLRAEHLWFHSAHILTKGTGFGGDHVDIYGLIYNELNESLDQAIEKAVGLTNIETVGCPLLITQGALTIISAYPRPPDQTAVSIAAAGLQIVRDYLDLTATLYASLKDSGLLSLGLDDFLMASANQQEKYVYLLQQRIKVELNI